MNQQKSTEDAFTLELFDPPEAKSLEKAILEENGERLESLLFELTEPDTAAPLCKPEPPLPENSIEEEKRVAPRFLVNWKVVVMNEVNGKRSFYHGRAYDISMGGLCLHSENNLIFTNSVIVLISVPPLSDKDKVHVIEVHSRISNTVLASDTKLFRIGVTFLRFKEGDERYLKKFLTERYQYFS